MIKKGDLVVIAEHIHAQADFVGNSVVLTDVYASIFTNKNESGAAIFTAEKLVVDILASGGKIYKKVPIELLTRSK